MRRLLAICGRALLVVPVAALVALIVGGALFGGPDHANAARSRPQIEVGTPSLVSGKVEVPIITTGSGFSAYSGFNIHLRWDATVFSFSSANITGTVIPTSVAPPFCVVNTATYDGDGGGVVYGCTGLSGTTSSTGLLGTIVLTPAASGCSDLHLFTYAVPPDNGTTGSGTYTNNPTAQTNTYVDGTADVSAASCTPGATATPTTTATPTISPTFAPATATASPIGGLRTITPSPTATVEASATTAPGGEPTQAATQPPSGNVPPPGGAPGGAGSGPITLPNTGASSGESPAAPVGGWLALAGALVLAGSGACWFGWERRRYHRGR